MKRTVFTGLMVMLILSTAVIAQAAHTHEYTKLTEILSSPNKDETIYFVVPEKFDSAKVMVWESLNNMKPICDAEIVK